MWVQLVFWILLFSIFYAYLGYGILLFLIIRFRRFFAGKRNLPEMPEDNLMLEVSFVVAAYNEALWIEEKIENSLAQNYPKSKIRFVFVTDGSNDDTPELIKKYKIQDDVSLTLYHQPERKGKIAAVNRIMPFIQSPVVIFTDANTTLNPDAVRSIVRHFYDEKVGAVSGEKRIHMGEKNEASGAGEGIYWKYESLLKKWDSELYSVVGAAGELFAIRRNLFEVIPEDTIAEDFYTTMRIAQRGYRVAYEPNAYAAESHSASVGEELKRKIRIAAGGMQAIVRLSPLLNPFRYGLLTFQYVSHRVLRWTIAPLSLPIVLLLSIYLSLQGLFLYQILLLLQVFFYLFSIIGYLMEKKELKFKAFFVPYYFCMMNYAIYRGFFRYLSGRQSVLWERAQRKV